MNDPSKLARLIAKKNQLQIMMAILLVFAIFGPWIGSKMFAERFARLHGVGLKVYSIGTHVAFTGVFCMYLAQHRRVSKRISLERSQLDAVPKPSPSVSGT
jgi:hypothetical protein